MGSFLGIIPGFWVSKNVEKSEDFPLSGGDSYQKIFRGDLMGSGMGCIMGELEVAKPPSRINRAAPMPPTP